MNTQSYYDVVVDQYDELVFPDYDSIDNTSEALKQYQKNIDDYFDMYIQFLSEDIDGFMKEMDKHPFIKIIETEFNKRSCLQLNYAEELDSIAKLFNESTIHPALYDCWFCRQKTDKVIKCTNNHTDFLCWNCAFTYIKQTGAIGFNCGICNKKLHMNKNSLLDSEPNQLQIIFPKFAIKMSSDHFSPNYFDECDLNRSTNPDYEYMLWIDMLFGHGFLFA